MICQKNYFSLQFINLNFYYENRDLKPEFLAEAVCKNEAFWGEDLTLIAGFEEAVVGYLYDIQRHGAYDVMKNLVSN